MPWSLYKQLLTRFIKSKKFGVFALTAIIILAGWLYIYKLGQVPPGVYLDEVGSGYNAYSILKTGKDEYGKFLPLAFRLFGSYTPPLYIYLSVPIMAIAGLSALSTRLLSVISGLSAIIIYYLLLKELNFLKNKYSGLISTLFFAVTPWLIFFSRMGYEQNLAFALFSLSVLLLAKSLKNPKKLLYAIPIMAFTTYADYPMRIVMPIFFLGALILFRKKLFAKKAIKPVIFGCTVAAIISIPNIYLLTTPSSYTKTEHFYSDVIFSQAKKIDHYLPAPLSVPLAFSREFLSQYFTYFSPRSLFFTPDSDPQRSMPELSVFYFWMVIPYLLGLYFLAKKRNEDYFKLILLLLLITPVPGALTRQPFHIQRTLGLLLPISLLMAVGWDNIFGFLKPKVAIGLTGILLIFSLILFWRSYFVLLPVIRASVWAFEFKPLAEYIAAHPNQKFIIDQPANPKPEEIAYEQLAFYLKIDPTIVQSDQNPDIAKNYYHETQFSPMHKFLNMEFRPIDWADAGKGDFVFVGDAAAISDLQIKLHSLKKVFEIDDPNNANIVLRGFVVSPK